MNSIYFSMIVYLDEEDLIKQSLTGILSTTALMKSKLKLIIVDPIATEETKAICDEAADCLEQEQYVYLQVPDMLIGDAYNQALEYTEGRYVNFSLASTCFEPATLDIIYALAEERNRPKLLSLAPWTINEKGETVQYKMSPKEDGQCVDINLHKTPSKLQLMFHAFFIRCYIIRSKDRKMNFKNDLLDEAPLELLCNLLAEFQEYTYLPQLKFFYTKQLEDNTSTFMNQHYSWWYMEAFRNWVLPFAEKWNAENYPLHTSMRLLLLYLVFTRINCNINDRDKGVISKEEIPELRMLIGKILQFVDNKYIFNKTSLQNHNIPRAMKVLLLQIKAEQAGCVCEPIINGGQVLLWTHKVSGNVTERAIEKMDFKTPIDPAIVENAGKELDTTSRAFNVVRGENDFPVLRWAGEEEILLPVCEMKKEHVIIQAINYERGCLKLDGILSLGNFFDRDKIKLFVYKDGKEYNKVEPFAMYDLRKVFGVTFAKDYRFYTEVPVFALNKKSSRITFAVEVNGEVIPIEIRTEGVYSHINDKVKGQYWRFDKEWCLSLSDKKALLMEKIDEKTAKKKEATFQAELKKIKTPFAQKALELRKRYFGTMEEFEGRRIWITFDKLYKAGDNGEYMYDYISTHDESIEICYMIKSDSPDYPRMLEKGDRLLVWGEDDAKLVALHAEAILDTHANAFSYMGFENEMKPFIGDLFNPKVICIQHGLTVQKIAQFQNRLFDNTALYLCASQHEVDNLLKPIYGYLDKKSIQLTGIARHDGLKSNDQRQILITPTWRRNIANSNVAHFKKGHNDYFKNSEYFKVYNSLINDPTLIATAKECNYKLIYLLHPAASAQVDDFDRNDYVELIPAAGDMNYEKILTESSLMVTDYSGVQFDFGYMRKPILYYHPAVLPPHYDESTAYVYDKDAFGPIIDNHEEMVRQLCEYMRNDCKTKPEFIKRGDDFFAYSDFGNCERIYNAIKKFLDK